MLSRIRKNESENVSGVSWESRMDVPEMPLSYSCTGAIKIVTPMALMTPARNSIRKFSGESFAPKASSFCFMVCTGTSSCIFYNVYKVYRIRGAAFIKKPLILARQKAADATRTSAAFYQKSE